MNPGFKILLTGPGRAGKDTVAEWFNRYTVLRYSGYGCSRAGLPHVAAALGLSEEEAWATRHARRSEWRRLMDEFRVDDPAMFSRICLSHGDILCGVRALPEFQATVQSGLVNLTIYVDRDVPPDETLEVLPGHCDLVLPNHGTLAELDVKLRRIAAAFQLSVRRVDDEREWCGTGGRVL
jgi:hypothetical protein